MTSSSVPCQLTGRDIWLEHKEIDVQITVALSVEEVVYAAAAQLKRSTKAQRILLPERRAMVTALIPSVTYA